MATKAQLAEQESAIEELRVILSPGDTMRTILRHVSRSGMSRSIGLIVLDEEGDIADISYLAARALGDKMDNTGDGIKVSGCGMDMGFHLVYGLGRKLFPTYTCLGARCPSNFHTNVRDGSTEGVHTDGYSLKQRWL